MSEGGRLRSTEDPAEPAEPLSIPDAPSGALPGDPEARVLDGRYRLDAALVSDTRGACWRAVDLRFGRVVLIRRAANAEVSRLAPILARRPHPSLPVLLEAGDDYLVLDPVGAVPEAHGAPLEAQTALLVAVQLLDGALTAARSGVVCSPPTLDRVWVAWEDRGPRALLLPERWVTVERTPGVPRARAPANVTWTDTEGADDVVWTSAWREAILALLRRVIPRDGRTVPSEVVSVVSELETGATLDPDDVLQLLRQAAQQGPDLGARKATLDNRYELLNTIGVGGMGQVHRALDHLTGRVVAVKVINTESSGRQAASLALTAEFRYLARLRHHNLAEVLDYGNSRARVGDIANGTPYVVTELYEGARHIVPAAALLDREGRAELLAQLLRGVAWLHRQGVLHRDLKPPNVLVVQGRVRIVDFGLAVEPENPSTRRVAGTLGYIAPEVLDGGRATVRSDLWSVGVVALEVLTGRTVPLTEDGRNLPVGPMLAELTPGHRLLVGALLAPNPADRPESADEALQLLGPAVADTGQRAAAPLRFYGRDAEKAVLETDLGRITHGRGGVRVVAGPAGIGKSRLLEEVRCAALVSGIAVIEVQGITERDRPYAAWQKLARWLASASAAPEAERALLSSLATPTRPGRRRGRRTDPQDEPAVSAARFSEDGPPRSGADGLASTDTPARGRMSSDDTLDEPSAPHAEPRLLDLGPQIARDRVAAAIRAGLDQVRRALLLLVEDAQWLPADDLHVLRLIMAWARQHPALVVIGWRDTDPRAWQERLGPVPAVVLEPLSAEALHALVLAALPASQRDPDRIAQIVARSDGNPLLLSELIRAESQGRPLGAGEVLESAVASTLQGLSESVQAVVRVAAVAGRQVDPTLITRLCGRESPPALEQARRAGVLEWREDRLQFTHDLLREALLRRMPPSERRAVHGKIAEALQQLGRSPARIAAHYAEAGASAESAFWLQRAGEVALAGGSLNEGVSLLERALGGPERVAPAVPIPLLASLGQACYALGQHEAAEAWLRRTFERGGEPIPDKGMYGRWTWTLLTRLLRLGATTPRNPAEARALVHSGVMLGLVFYNARRTFTTLLQTISTIVLAEQVREWGYASRLWGGLQLVFGGLGFHGLAARAGRRSTRLGVRAGDDPQRGGGLIAQAFYYGSLGRTAEATAAARDALARYSALMDPRSADEARWALASIDAQIGRFAEAMTQYRDIVASAERRGDEQMRTFALHGQVHAAVELGAFHLAEEAFSRIDPTLGFDPEAYQVLRSSLALASGRLRTAIEAAFAAVQPITKSPIDGFIRVNVAILAAEVLSAVARRAPAELSGEHDTILQEVNRLMWLLRRQIAATPCIAPAVYRIAARIEADPKAREALLERAARAAERLGNTTEMSRISAER